MKKTLLLLVIITLLVPMTVWADENYDDQNEETVSDNERGKIIEVISEINVEDLSGEDEFEYPRQIVKIRILTGKYKGQEFIIENALPDIEIYEIRVSKGDEVILEVQEEGDIPTFYIADFARDKYLMYLIIAFTILLIAVGGIKGVKSMVTLLITGVIIWKGMLPLILKGYNPIWVSIVSSIVITVLTLVIVAGINMKSISAMIGTAGGVLVAGFLAYLIGTAAKLTGLSSHESNMLMYIPQNISFDFRGLLFSGIIIGTLGAVMDVGMSIASSMHEMLEIHPEISPKELIKSGLNVGKDVMGTMTNTLILAYTGSSIPLLLIFMAYETSIVEVFNLDLMATEVVRSLAGSIGIIVAIPITAFTTGFILKRKNDM